MHINVSETDTYLESCDLGLELSADEVFDYLDDLRDSGRLWETLGD